LMRMVRCTSMTITLASVGFAQINARRINRQGRIAHGIRSGQLTAGETAKLEHRNRELIARSAGIAQPTVAGSLRANALT
jgi:hypothetical protein